MQKNLAEAHEQGRLELDKWAQIMIQRIRLNFGVQRIWPEGAGGGGPYRNYWIVNMSRKGKYKSTGEAFLPQNLYAKVLAGARGDTVAVDFFFKHYLLFVDWGVGKGQKKAQVPEAGVPKMKRRYAIWAKTGDRQRRPVVMGAIKGGRFFLANILMEYWKKEAETVVLFGLGFGDKGSYKEFSNPLLK